MSRFAFITSIAFFDGVFNSDQSNVVLFLQPEVSPLAGGFEIAG